MKTAKEFIERLQSDELFAVQMKEKVEASGASTVQEAFAAVSAAAAELGYEISPEQLREIAAAQNEDFSDEELGKVAGGTSPLISLIASDMTCSIFSMVMASLSYA